MTQSPESSYHAFFIFTPFYISIPISQFQQPISYILRTSEHHNSPSENNTITKSRLDHVIVSTLTNLPQASKYASTHTTTTAPSLEMCEYKYYNYRCGCVCVHQKTACGKECPPVPTKVSPPKRQCAKCLRKKREARAEVKAQFAAWKGFVCNDSNEPPSEPVSPRSKPDEQAES